MALSVKPIALAAMLTLASMLAHAVEIQSWVSPQQARVLLVEAHGNPMLDVR
jgi:zinc protease